MRNKLFASAKGVISLSWCIAVLFLFVAVPSEFAYGGTWTTKTSMPAARSYVAGGSNSTGTLATVEAFTFETVIVDDTFSGPPLDTTKFEVSTTGLGHYNIYEWNGRSSLVLNSGYGGSGSAVVKSKEAFSLTNTSMVIFEGIISAYSERHWYPGVYGDRQPRGLRVGTDTNNAIEFISYARDTVEARTVASGIATTTQYVLPSGTQVERISEWVRYRIEATSSSVKFYVDNVQIATHTANIPTGSLNLYMGTSYGGYGNVNVGADWLYLAIAEEVDTTLPTATTGSATNVTSSSATLNGTVNANGLSTTAWFNYGIASGSYTGTSTTQSVSGSSDTTVGIGISGLSSSTTYYYRIAAQNSAGTSYGSESTFTTLSPPNTAPVAHAGPDQTVYVGNTVTLDGSGSYDADGDLLTYSWAFTSKPADSTATLSDAAAVKPTFTVDKAGTYVVSLMVNDGTLNSAAATLTISTLNSAPVANAGTDQTPFVNDTVTLNGSGSYDVDGNTLTFTWAFTSKPADSTATLSDAAAVKPTFMVDKAGMYVVSLIVNDGMVDSSAADTVTISTLNSAPVANAGADQTPYVNDTVTLDGSNSSDVDGNLLTFSWAFTSKPADSTATPSDAAAVKPTFTVDKAGTYVVSLFVNDGTANSAADTVTISTSNSAPVANAGPDQTPLVNDTVTLNGGGSYDVDGNTLTFSWAFTSVPAGSSAVLSSSTSVNPTFTVDKAGMYVVSLMVNDGTVNSAADTVTISTLNSAPVAKAGPDQSKYVGDTVTLDGSGSYDVDGNLLTYSWAFTSKPADSTATLSDATAVNPTFTVDKAGTYVASLIVNDGTVNSAPDTITISTINVAPVANAGADQSVNVGNTATLNGGGSSDADGDAITYSWSFTTKPSGSTAALSGATSANPTFTADKAGTYVVSLIVNDGAVNSSPDTVTITANAVTINVEVEIKPETINLKSKGKFKAVIKFPESYSADTVVLATVVCGGAHAIKGKFDDDDDDKNRYTARFNVQDLSITVNSKKEEVTLTVSGELEDGTKFTGSDTVKVKGEEKEKEKKKDK